nr:hypothetical protein [Bacteroides intestinalis]
MITRTMNPFTLRREMQKDIFDNIVPYLRRNYDSKIRRAIIKSLHLPMIFNPIHYFSKTTNNDWFIFYYAISKKLAEDAACIAVSQVQTEEGTYVYEYIVAREHNIYVFPPHFFSRYHSRFLKEAAIDKQELINQCIRNSYLGIMLILGTGQDKCAMSFQDGYAIGDIISRKERVFMFKTFISKDLLRKDQAFAKVYDQLQEQNLLDYIVSLENPDEFFKKEYGFYLDTKL